MAPSLGPAETPIKSPTGTPKSPALAHPAIAPVWSTPTLMSPSLTHPDKLPPIDVAGPSLAHPAIAPIWSSPTLEKPALLSPAKSPTDVVSPSLAHPAIAPVWSSPTWNNPNFTTSPVGFPPILNNDEDYQQLSTPALEHTKSVPSINVLALSLILVVLLLFLVALKVGMKHRESSYPRPKSFYSKVADLMTRNKLENCSNGSQEDLSILSTDMLVSDDLLVDMESTNNIRLYGFRSRHQSSKSLTGKGPD